MRSRKPVSRATVLFAFALFVSALLAFLGLAPAAQAQTGVIAGTVADSLSGATLPGANVVIEGTQKGGSVGAEGRYVISGLEPGSYDVRTSFVGYAAKTVEEVVVRAGDTTTVNFDLRAATVSLDQVVAIGYGTERRSDLTGSVSSVGIEEPNEVPVTTVEEVLQGRVAGLVANQYDASPGGGFSLRIRGSATLGNNQPLYVIDGVPIKGGNTQPQGGFGDDVPAPNLLNFLNPGDIESIEVLKGPSATAIYGSRGANGVLIITTSRGRTEGTSFQVNYSVTGTSPSKTVDVLEPAEYAAYRNMQLINRYYVARGLRYEEILEQIDLPFPGAENQDGEYVPSPEEYASGEYATTDWQDQVYERSLYTSNFSLSAQGALSDDANYYLSGSLHRPNGVIAGSGFERYTFTSNFDATVAEGLSLSNRLKASAAYANRSQTSVSNRGDDRGTVVRAIGFPPTSAIGEVQERRQTGEIGLGDPYTMATEFVDERDDYNVIESLELSYAITDAFTLSVSGGARYTYQSRDMYFPLSTQRGAIRNGSARTSYSQQLHLLNDNLLKYQQRFGDHSLNATAGFSQETNSIRNQFLYANGFASDRLGYQGIGQADQFFNPNTGYVDFTLNSFLGRFNYRFQDRYLFTVTMRADGSSRFGENNKWGYFPSGAFAWRVAQEPFMQGVGAISTLKLRTEYGVSGNRGIQPYQSLATLNSVRYTLDNTSSVTGFQNASIPNPDLKWEATRQANVGVDLGLFDGRFQLTADAYRKNTVDILQEVRIPSSTGYSFQWQNLGAMVNRGIEFQVEGEILQDAPFTWNASVNYSANRNEITDLGRNDVIQGRSVLGTEFFPFKLKVGEPLGSVYGYRTDGIFQNQEEVDRHADQRNKEVGGFRLVDANEDGTINSEDQVRLGNTQPDHVLGLSNTFRYKSFDLSVQMTAKLGQDRLNMGYFRFGRLDGSDNVYEWVYDNAWRPEIRDAEGNVVQEGNTDAEWHMVGPEARASDRVLDKWVEDASYFRIQNLRLGYTYPGAVLGLDQLRAYVTLRNALTLTGYSGTNPEASLYGQDPTRFGVDFGGYPQVRSLLLGVQMSF